MGTCTNLLNACSITISITGDRAAIYSHSSFTLLMLAPTQYLLHPYIFRMSCPAQDSPGCENKTGSKGKVIWKPELKGGVWVVDPPPSLCPFTLFPNQSLAISNSKWQLLMLPKAAGYLSTQQRNEMGSLLALLLKSEHLAGAITGEAQVNFRSNTITVSVNITFKLPKLNAPFWYLIS